MRPLPLQFFIAMIAHAVNERMARKMEYMQEEIQVLNEALAAKTGSQRITFTAEQRRRLALKGKKLTPKERRACCQIMKPETSNGLNVEIGRTTVKAEEVDVAMYASLTRVLEHAPVQNRLRIFGMMARIAVDDLIGRRQQYVDDLWDVARETGLIDLLGATTVQAALSVEFKNT